MNQLCIDCGGACCKFVTIPLDMVRYRFDRDWLKARGKLLPDGRWIIEARCPKLGVNGRCKCYDERPLACMDYEVGGEACMEVRGEEKQES